MRRESFIARREELGLSQETFARLIGADARSVRRWDQGESLPRGFRLQRIAEVLQVTPDALKQLLGGATDPFALGEPGKVCVDEPPARSPGGGTSFVNRREFLRAAGVVAGSAAAGWLVGDAPARVTPATVEAITTLTSQLRVFDNRFGGGAAKTVATSYLDTEVIPLIRHGAYPEALGRQLTGAAAQLAQLAGWTCYDQDQHDMAESYLEQAIALASMAGDEAFEGEVLAGLSHHAIHLARPVRALGLARAARDKAIKTNVPALTAEAQALEAQADALLGDRSASERALNRAEHAIERVDPQNLPPWLTYFDENYLAARFAHCFAYLNDWGRCETFARHCLDMRPDLGRTRSFNLVMLAHAHVATDPGQAAAIGIETMELAGGLQSKRILEYLRGLSRRLHDTGSADTTVKQFQQQSVAILGAHQ